MRGLREKIGQLIVVGIKGEMPDAEERLMSEEYAFGGFVLFKRNCLEAGQLLSLSQALWKTGLDLPPFIAIDHEGGRVHRLPPPFTHFPAAQDIGLTNDPSLAYRCGRAAATELMLAGINLNFAPVLDVDSNPQNSVIGDRAFGADPQTVTAIAWSWTQGLRSVGVIPCAKHFPGYGNADKDSHIESSQVKKPLAMLKAVDLPPFVHATQNHIEALMTSHVLYPALDTRWPATLSEKIVTGLLRLQLGYGGLVFSDDMEMKAISDHYSVEEAALRAVDAGVDVLLFCHELSRAVRALEFLHAESEKDAALRGRIDASYGRIENLKRRCLQKFTGATKDELPKWLAALDHQRTLAAIYGSL